MTGKMQVLMWVLVSMGTSAEILVDDSNKTLTNIPSTYHSSITKLILKHNLITMSSLDAATLRNYTNLTELDLSYNSITWLSAEAFSSLRNLEDLSLKGNKLQTLDNKTFTDLKNLKKLDLSENPWNCSVPFLKLIKWMNDSGVQTGGLNMTCSTPEETSTKNSPNLIRESLLTTTTNTSSPSSAFTTTRTATQGPSHVPTTSSEDKPVGSKKPRVNNTWKFLAGVIVIILCTSTIIVCAVKSPTWYKMLFNYRHQRLREPEEPGRFSTGRHSDFSLDTEQTETSASELDQGLAGINENEDGFIEDGYIQPEDYKDHTDAEDL